MILSGVSTYPFECGVDRYTQVLIHVVSIQAIRYWETRLWATEKKLESSGPNTMRSVYQRELARAAFGTRISA